MDVDIDLASSSPLHVPVNVEDYIFRGHELTDYSIYELAMVAYAKATTKTEMSRYNQAQQLTYMESSKPWNRRVLFLQMHTKAATRCIMFQRNTKVPCIIG